MPFKFKKIELNKEIPSIEFLRGLASVLVCYFHIARGNKTFLPNTSILKQAGAWGWSGVEIFFVISGFVIPYAMYVKNYSIHNFFTFLKKRIIRIEPPYILSIVLVILLNYISTISPYYRGAPFTIDWKNLLWHLGYINNFSGGNWLNPVYWSLAIEFQYYILIAVSFSLIVSKLPIYRVLFFVVFVALSFVFNSSYVFSFAPFFMLGILLFQYVTKVVHKNEFYITLALVIAILLYKSGIVLTLIVCVALLIIAYVNEVPPVFRKLGLISYSLYLVHVPVGGRIINISEVLFKNIYAREVMVFVAFAVSIIASILFYNLVEKRFKILSSNIKYK